jgi:glycosyltransferase involved in cell wall biosynthesis
MRILYSFPHMIGAPGIGTTAIQQVRGLLGRGHHVTVVATSVHPNAGDLSSAKKTMVFGGLRVPHRVLGLDRTMGYHDLRVAAHIGRNAGSYDVVHCWPGATLATCRAAAVAGIAAVREVPNTHTANAYDVVGALCAELGIELPPGHSHRLDVGRLKKEESEYRVAPHLLVPSDYVRSTFVSRGFAQDKLLSHQYGFDPDVFTLGTEARQPPLHVVFVGSVEPRKGMHVALEAWRKSGADANARLSVYGRVVDSYRAVLSEYRDIKNVEFHGFTNNTADVFRAADALVLPSFEEGSALVTYEAQGCGAVPLVSDATGARCIHEISGMVHPAGDADILASHIRRLNEDRTFLETLRKGVVAQRDQLTWAHAAKRLEDCYKTATAAVGHRGPVEGRR